jgi:hypothetical protein
MTVLPTDPRVLSILAESRLDSVRLQEATFAKRSGVRRRAGRWLVSAGLKLAPELRQKLIAEG